MEGNNLQNIKKQLLILKFITSCLDSCPKREGGTPNNNRENNNDNSEKQTNH